MNKALLRKFSWKFMVSDSFVFDFLRARYMSLLQRRSRYINSSIWPVLQSNYLSLLAECRWLVGIHSRRKFWQDNWLGTPITDLLNLPPQSWNQNILVRDLISHGHWDLPTQFQDKFPQLSKLIETTCIIDTPD